MKATAQFKPEARGVAYIVCDTNADNRHDKLKDIETELATPEIDTAIVDLRSPDRHLIYSVGEAKDGRPELGLIVLQRLAEDDARAMATIVGRLVGMEPPLSRGDVVSLGRTKVRADQVQDSDYDLYRNTFETLADPNVKLLHLVPVAGDTPETRGSNR